ncbi:MAG TPA: 2-C-methyl-D-erythritol 2,4-cyclodiphosphate synthase [Candidatus Krumholzibacteria bacterium]|nr:2-C-methyl-D-erythritol 2,4-cyclodiphosphate synthase [Candidatus Krumholzibacteria bacterium]HPD71041.1 2-C-methyl-D-erythritol 2,4-cyclodiphosphate synthase [Candidatus Krumholzibacteria bacterium]HRY39259.1 2-C-methyl-D-erythritol 2,4-cyclodiphosphate synthase [Candidatus Krumholzibacteria bacterium]
MRIGFGLDRHRLVAGVRCILGGVEFPDCPVGPAGHSDGDAVCHAVADAILGAACLGDLGHHFPDTDPRYAGADSVALLARTAALARRGGWAVGNVDVTVMTEQPFLSPARAPMQANLARALGIEPDHVSIKATRGEEVGPEGRGEALTVHAVALLVAVEARDE